MKILDLALANDTLAHYAKGLKDGSVVLTKNSKPVAALVSLPAGMDIETLSLSQNPKFLALLENSRASIRHKGAIPIEDVRKHLGLQNSKSSKRRKK